jgi:hypothetical protein
MVSPDSTPTQCSDSTSAPLRPLLLPPTQPPVPTSRTVSAPSLPLSSHPETVAGAQTSNQAPQVAGASMSTPASTSQEMRITPPTTHVARSISIPPVLLRSPTCSHTISLPYLPLSHTPDSWGSSALQQARLHPPWVRVQLSDDTTKSSNTRPLPSPPATSSPDNGRGTGDPNWSASASHDLENGGLTGSAEYDGQESQAGSGPEDIQMASEAEVGSVPEVSATNGRKMFPKPVSPAIGDCGQSVSGHAGEGRAPSPPSTSLSDPSAGICPPYEPDTELVPLPNNDPTMSPPTPFHPNFPTMSPPSSIEPEEVAESRDAHQSLCQQHSLEYRPKNGIFPRITSLVTPPPPSPSPFEVRQLQEEGDSALVSMRDADDAKAVERSGGSVGEESTDALNSNEGTGAGRDHAMVDKTTGATLVPAISITYSSEAVNASIVPSSDIFAGSGGSPVASGSEVDQDIDPELHGDLDLLHPPANECDLSHPLSPQYPLPSTSAVPSRDPTPSDSHQTHDEDEVWRALVLGTPETTSSSVPDPIPPLPIPSNYPSRSLPVHPEFPSTSGNENPDDHLAYPPSSSSPLALLAIDPSMLHQRTPIHLGPEPPGAPHLPEGSLSSLTSLDEDAETEVNDDLRSLEDDEPIGTYLLRAQGKKRGTKTIGVSTNGNRGRRSEPYCAPLASHALSDFNPNPLRLSHSMPHVRAASEASVSGRGRSRPVGGPSACLSELAMLARREPLRIHFKVPESMRGLKRKWDVVASREVVREEDGAGKGSGTGTDTDADAGREGAMIGTSGDNNVRNREEEGRSMSVAVRRRRGLCVMIR